MPKNDADELQTTLAKLVVAHHILHQQGVLSSSSAGGVYVRNPLNHNVFFSSDMVGTAPGLIEGRGDLRGWNVGDGESLCYCFCCILCFFAVRSGWMRESARVCVSAVL